MNKKIIISLLLIGVLAFGAGIGTYAWFTSTATSSNNTFTAGTLKIDVNDSLNNNNTFSILSTGNMAPGQSTGKATLVIENQGNLNLGMFRQFRLAADSSEIMAKALVVSTFKITDPSIPNGLDLTTHAHWTTNRWDIDGVGGVTLWDLANRVTDVSNDGWDIFGLKPNGSQTIEIEFTLPETVGNEVQGLSATLAMNVRATQINAGAIEALMTGQQLKQTPAWIANQLNNHTINY